MCSIWGNIQESVASGWGGGGDRRTQNMRRILANHVTFGEERENGKKAIAYTQRKLILKSTLYLLI